MKVNKEENFISAVVYVNNNEKSIKILLKKIETVFDEIFNKYEIICVNDASTDNSVKVIKEFAKQAKDKKISVINMSYYQGLEKSMDAGVDLAIGDFVYEFDNIYDDFSEKIIKDIYYTCLKGYDIVSASSSSKQFNPSSFFYKIFNKYANLEYKLQTESFRIISRRAINRVNSINKNIVYRKAVYANCGLKMLNISYESNKNVKKPVSKECQKNKANTAINSLILFTNVGYKVSLFLSTLMLLSTVLVAIYAITIFINKDPVQGWTTTILFLSFGFFGIFSLITIAIKYLDTLVDLQFKKKLYLIESIDKLN